MERKSGKKRLKFNMGRQAILTFIVLLCLIFAAVAVFLKFYNNYNDDILYRERLNQMKEVTEQLFSGLEDVVEVQWSNAQYQCNYLKRHAPVTEDDLQKLMKQQTYMADMDRKQTRLIAIDTQGRYYDPDGKQGLIDDMSYFTGKPSQVSYVFNDMTTARADMLFLYRMDEPVDIEAGEKTIQILYYGLAVDMEQLNPYFDCKAYSGNNSTYVADKNGLKLFTGNSGNDVLEGFNVFSELRNMKYLHDLTFDETLQTMQDTGLAYSNAILYGEEYYYALYRMDNSEWILLFLVPSRYVATNTVRLVETTTKLLLVFAVFMTLICTVLIYIVLRIQQRKSLQIVNNANAVLEANNKKLELAQETTTNALHAAEIASKAKTEFLSNMSHDIRTPMNAIVGITKLMAHDKNDPEKMDAYIEKVQMSSQHLLSLINDVLDMSKIESSEVSLNKEMIELADQLDQIDSIARPQMEEKEQKFTIRIYNITHEHLIGDAVRFRQVIINLLSNAMKYTPRGGSIWFDLEELSCEIPDHTKLRISVTDSGYGMTPEFVEHIFEPFTRAVNSTTNRIQGTGLGMAITKNIVDLAGGTISVQSEVNKGSCFTVELPLLIDRETETTLPAKTVLLITDDAVFINNVRASFKETDITLLVEQSIAGADDILHDDKPDIVLLGHLTNETDLTETIHVLREKTKGILLFFCCGISKKEKITAFVKKGDLDDVILRPFFLSDLARTVERVHSRSASKLPENTSVLKGMRFLCAEDNDLNAEILEAMLDMNGADCVIYPDGQKIVDAFAAVKPGEFNAILMDVQMPVMNGLDAAREIRKGKNPLGRTIPIIAMTANAFSEDVQSCLNAGMDVHISKPIDIAALERAMKSFTSGKFSGGGQMYVRRRQ